MSIGNTKDNGNKGSNFPYQRAVTKLLSEIACNSLIPPCCPTAATEITLLGILAALQNGQEFEQTLVTDLGGVGCPTNCPTYIQIRIFNTDTHTFDPPIYYDAVGTIVIPVGPLQFINPQYVLENILTQTSAINTILTGVTRTPSLLRVIGAGAASIAAGSRSVSVYNAGMTNGTWLGATIKQGEQFSYSADGEDDVLGAFSYDALTTELVITTVV